MAPFEDGVLGRARSIAWSEVPHTGLGLELGAGTGANFRFHRAGTRVVAVDVSPPLLRAARAKEGADGVMLVVADAQALPFRDGTFEWAAETLLFCQLADPRAGMREAARVLQPDATFVMLEHVRPHGWLGIAADLVSRLTGRLWGERFDRSPEPALAAADFRILRRSFLWRDVLELFVSARAPATTIRKRLERQPAPYPSRRHRRGGRRREAESGR